MIDTGPYPPKAPDRVAMQSDVDTLARRVLELSKAVETLADLLKRHIDHTCQLTTEVRRLKSRT